MWPEVRIIAGMLASTITSLGTCRLVMPLSESTMAMAGPSARSFSTAALIAAAVSPPTFSAPERMPPRPLLGSRPCSSSASPCSAKSVGKNACTAWPKMIGSETFIMVALRWTENSTSSALARAIWSRRNDCSAAVFMKVASTTSPASTGTDSLSTSVPLSVTSSMRSDPAFSITADFSLDRKSSEVMCATLVFESGDHFPIECGCWRA